MAITISQVEFDTGKRHKIATFRMSGGKLVAEWAPDMDDFQVEIEESGIVANGKVYRPSDGKQFYDNLPEAYAHSSSIAITKSSK